MAFRKIPFRGGEVTFVELSARFAIPITTLRSRWCNGKREEDLVAPPDPAKCSKKHYAKYQAYAATHQRRKETELLRASLAAEHAALLTKPLIDATLVSAQERSEIRQRVRISHGLDLDGDA